MGIFWNFLVRVENVSGGAVFHPQQKILASSTQSDIKKKTLITVRLTIWNRLSIELEHYLKFPGKSHHLFQKDFFVTLKNRRMWGRRVRWDPRRCRPARLMKLILAGLCVSRIDGNFLERSSMSTPTHSKPIEISLLKVVFNR